MGELSQVVGVEAASGNLPLLGHFLGHSFIHQTFMEH
jgi:hypothetical protein